MCLAEFHLTVFCCCPVPGVIKLRTYVGSLNILSFRRPPGRFVVRCYPPSWCYAKIRTSRSFLDMCLSGVARVFVLFCCPLSWSDWVTHFPLISQWVSFWILPDAFWCCPFPEVTKSRTYRGFLNICLSGSNPDISLFIAAPLPDVTKLLAYREFLDMGLWSLPGCLFYFATPALGVTELLTFRGFLNMCISEFHPGVCWCTLPGVTELLTYRGCRDLCLSGDDQGVFVVCCCPPFWIDWITHLPWLFKRCLILQSALGFVLLHPFLNVLDFWITVDWWICVFPESAWVLFLLPPSVLKLPNY